MAPFVLIAEVKFKYFTCIVYLNIIITIIYSRYIYIYIYIYYSIYTIVTTCLSCTLSNIETSILNLITYIIIKTNSGYIRYRPYNVLADYIT